MKLAEATTVPYTDVVSPIFEWKPKPDEDRRAYRVAWRDRYRFCADVLGCAASWGLGDTDRLPIQHDLRPELYAKSIEYTADDLLLASGTMVVTFAKPAFEVRQESWRDRPPLL